MYGTEAHVCDITAIRQCVETIQEEPKLKLYNAQKIR